MVREIEVVPGVIMKRKKISCKICHRKINSICTDCGYESINNELNEDVELISVSGFELMWKSGQAIIYKAPKNLPWEVLRKFEMPELTPKLAQEWKKRLKGYQVLL